jgi:hypothetical protein
MFYIGNGASIQIYVPEIDKKDINQFFERIDQK